MDFPIKNGVFSIAMLNYQRVAYFLTFFASNILRNYMFDSYCPCELFETPLNISMINNELIYNYIQLFDIYIYIQWFCVCFTDMFLVWSKTFALHCAALFSGPGHAFRISQVTPACFDSTVGCAATGGWPKIVVYHQLSLDWFKGKS